MTTSDTKPHDLTAQIAPNLDPHMILPLLEYLESAKLYNPKEVAASRLEILQPTHMVDYAMEVYKVVHGKDAPAEMNAQKEKVLKELEELRAQCAPLSKVCEDPAEKVRQGYAKRSLSLFLWKQETHYLFSEQTCRQWTMECGWT